VSEDNVQVILLRLTHMEEMLSQIHDEVKRTNGRVTRLEMESARWEGEERAKRMQNIVVSSVISGGILAGIVWFVTQAI
jgi:hypothetical protein